MSTLDKGKKKEDGELSNDEDQLPSKNSKKGTDEGRYSRQDKGKTNKSESKDNRKVQVTRKSKTNSPENPHHNRSQQLSLFGGPAIPRRAAFQQAQRLFLCLDLSRNEGQQKFPRSPENLEEKHEIIDLAYVKDDDLRQLEELNDGRYSGMESQESSSEEVKRKDDRKSRELKKDNRKREEQPSRNSKGRNDERLDKRDKNNGRDKRDRSREKGQNDRQRDNKNNYSRRERSVSNKRDHSTSKKRDHSASRRSKDRNNKDTSKTRDHSHSKRRNNQSKRRDEQSSSRIKSRSGSKRKEHSQSRRKDRSASKKRKHSHSKRRGNRSGSKKRASSHSKKRSASGRRQESNSRKDKRTQRQEGKSNKGRSKSRGNSKLKDNENNRNSETSKQQSNRSGKQKDEIYKESSKIEMENEVLSEQDNALMMEMMENSDDERERKKRELLELIKGIKETNINTNISGSSKQDSQNIVERKEDLPLLPEEDGFDNDLINPDDAIDDEEDEQNDHCEQPYKKRKIEDDYQGQNDADIEAAIQLRRRRSSQDNLNYLKNLEEMRNLEIKEGLEGQEQPGLVDENENNEKDNLPQQTNLKHRDSIQKSFHENDMEEEYNSLHKLDDEKEPSDSEGDMFGDDVEKFIGDTKNKYGKVVNVECDDEQNYFKVRIGEILGSNYRIVSKCGKGVFANVVKAEQLDNGKLVAIKILRSNEIMHESGEREKEIVQKLNLSDKKHIVRLKNVFEQSKHICLVFECFQMNLREALKIYGKGKGFNLDIVRSYAFQIFIALTHIKKNRFIHADLKPDNLLISEDTKTLKMCDFGTALSVEENGIIKYIQSRYYRAPEVLIGYPPYNQIDVWSIGVTLYEIYTNKYLFDGSTNNEMIKLIMDARGKFNKKMLQSGSFVEEYFDANYVFQYVQVDPLTKQKYVTAIKYGDIPKNDISKLLQTNKEGVQFENQKKLAQFKDFLDKCLQLDPKNRLTPEEALKHPFLDTTVKAK